MKIALFCPTVSGKGGMETAIRNLLAGFRATGDDCRLFMLGGSVDKTWLSDLPHVAIGSPQDFKPLKFAKYAVMPALALRKWQPDAIIAADVTTLRMAVWARKLARQPHIPIASWIHFPVSGVRMKEYLHEADCHLAISDDIAEDLRAFLPQQSSRVFTIYNGIDASAVSLLPRPEAPAFLYIGRLTYDDQKRVNDILQALSRLRGECRMTIIGEAPKLRAQDGERLRALAEELGISERVAWMGWQADPWKAAASATALVLASAHEGFPMILLEAISRGVPCISSDCKSGPSEMIDEGKNGWLYPVGNVEQLAALMQRVIDAPHALPSPLSVQATIQRFSAEAVALRARQALLSVANR